MDVIWDPAKDTANLAKHGLSFADFNGFDAAPQVVADRRLDYGEDRFRAFGRVSGAGRCLVFTVRDGALRAISYRRAHDKELRRYGI